MPDDKKLSVAFAIDEAFVKHFCVALTSLLETNRDLVDRVFLIHSISNNSDCLSKTARFFKEKYSVDVELLQTEEDAFKALWISNHISHASYHKLVLPLQLPQDVTQVLYLDSDIVVCGDIRELAGISFDSNAGVYAYAVEDMFPVDIINAKCNVNIQKYFNAGMMLLNVCDLRNDNAVQDMLNIALDKKDNLMHHDQDVLNIFFDGKWQELDKTYNAHNLIHKLDYLPKIIHFTTSYKPWHFGNRHPYRQYYWFYRNKTPFRTCWPSFNIPIMYILKLHMPYKLKKCIKYLWYNLPLVKIKATK